MKILLVDDDRELGELLSFAFKRAGFVPLIAHDADGAVRLFESERPDLLVLDINLGGSSGIDVLRHVRRVSSQIPVVLLTALTSEEDKVRGLEQGADDYVTKPFSHRELVARARAHLRRAGQDVPDQDPGPQILQAGPLELNAAEHVVRLGGEVVDLTVTEFRVLHVLMRSVGTVVPTRVLLKRVWGHEDPSGADVVRVAVHRLRRKLHEDAEHPTLLHTVQGVGVMLKPTSPVAVARS